MDGTAKGGVRLLDVPDASEPVRPRVRGDARRGDAVLVAAAIHKRFGAVHALRGADLALRAGEVHALVGHNGSGKSTLLRVLSGQIAPDAGQLTLRGRPVGFPDPRAAIASGIAAVAQETALVAHLSVAENILLGHRAVRRAYGIDWPATRRRAAQTLERLGVEIDPRAPVASLAPDQQQLVEIARALSTDVRVLVLDEPTSVLTDDEVAGLFDVVRALRGQGLATVFVSHRLAEVLEVADRVTVLRDGKTVGRGDAAGYDEQRLIAEMAAGELVDAPSAVESPARAGAARPRLRLRDVCIERAVSGASLAVAPGETVGLAGLVGAGRRELVEAIFGARPIAAGVVELDGTPLNGGGPSEAIARGIAFVPADRRRGGLVLGMTVRENLLMARTARHRRLRRPRRGWEAREAQALMQAFGVRTPSAAVPAAALSGGNQQKVLLAKWMSVEPGLLLLDEPTRGVDVGPKAEIYRLLARARESGAADAGQLVGVRRAAAAV